MLKGAKAYLQTQVNTTTQGDLLIMLYDGAIKFLSQAKEKMAERDFAQKGILISKAIDVIGELDSSLNAERGGEVAQNLHQLYFYCNTRLLRANLEMNTDLVDETIRILTALRDAFDKIKSEAPPVAPPATGSSMLSMPGPGQQSAAPTASAAQASAAYGRPRPAGPADSPAHDASPAAGASGAAPATQTPRPGPRLVRGPGLPGAYGNPGGTG